MLTQYLGYPRISGHRELKKALESFWKKEISTSQLEDTARSIRQENWELQRSNHIDLIPSNDFSLYEHVLDMSIMLGAIPHRFNKQSFLNKYEAYFSMARGYQDRNGQFIPPMEMTKWFNTNYHYIVPEISQESTFKLNQEKITREIQETKDIGVQSVPVIIGPVTYLLLSKSTREGYSPLDKLEELLPIYKKHLS